MERYQHCRGMRAQCTYRFIRSAQGEKKIINVMENELDTLLSATL